MSTTSLADDVYRRYREALLAKDNAPKVVVANVDLDDGDKLFLWNSINNSLIKNGNVPEYHANIISDSILATIAEFINFKVRKEKEKQANISLREELMAGTEEDHKNIGQLFQRNYEPNSNDIDEMLKDLGAYEK